MGTASGALATDAEVGGRCSALADRLPAAEPFGGGGKAEVEDVALLGSFLLTQRFRSSSK